MLFQATGLLTGASSNLGGANNQRASRDKWRNFRRCQPRSLAFHQRPLELRKTLLEDEVSRVIDGLAFAVFVECVQAGFPFNFNWSEIFLDVFHVFLLPQKYLQGEIKNLSNKK
jgi:hypothetical protein